MPIEHQVIVLFGATKGYLDKIEVTEVLKFTDGAVKEVSPDLLKKIKAAGNLDDALFNELHEFYKGYVNRYLQAK